MFFFFNDTGTTEIYTVLTHSFPTRRSSDLCRTAAPAARGAAGGRDGPPDETRTGDLPPRRLPARGPEAARSRPRAPQARSRRDHPAHPGARPARSAERRVGKEGVQTGRSGGTQ